MEIKEKILKYIQETYSPLTIFIYGSFSRGTNNKTSDFDSLIIVKEKRISYDNTIIENIPLDLFIYSLDEVSSLENYSNFVHLYDSTIILDTNEIGLSFLEKIQKYVTTTSIKSDEEKQHLTNWIKKMITRIKREDTEGIYRYHWLMTDSLELYCIFRDKFYFGPKYTIEYLKDNDKLGFLIFTQALKNFNIKNVILWCNYVRNIVLETERLYLRKLNKNDFKNLCKILQDSEVMYAYEHAFSDEEVQEWLDRQLKRYEIDGFGLWGVVLKETDEMIGQCGLTLQDYRDKKVVEVGYLFQKRFWNKGYAIESAKACRDYAFDVLGVDEVFSIIRDNNLSSQKVAIKNGMEKRDIIVKHYYNMDMPHFIFSIKKDDLLK